MIYVVFAIFVLTYFLLIFRKIGTRNIPIWASMGIGAVLMLATLSISPLDAFHSIDFRVIAFLFGMLAITAGFEKSGLIEYLVLVLLRRAKNFDSLLLGLVFASGLLSAFLVNDTIALLLTPLALGIAAKMGLKNTRAILIPLAFGITTGSVFTPIGNPQNLLVTLNSGIKNPFGEFALYLFVPSMLGLLVIYYLSKLFFRHDYLSISSFDEVKPQLANPASAITDMKLAKLSASILGVLVVGFLVVEAVPQLQSVGITVYNLAFAFGLLLLVLSPSRSYLAVSMNWGILVFFAGMFVVMSAVWSSHIGSFLLSALPTPILGNRVQSAASIFLVSVTLSQILSNVPFVQLYTFQMNAIGFTAAHVAAWMALAAGATLAGNLSLLGAVSNVIIIESAEARHSHSFSFLEFLKYGTIVTIVTVLIFLAYFALI